MWIMSPKRLEVSRGHGTEALEMINCNCVETSRSGSLIVDCNFTVGHNTRFLTEIEVEVEFGSLSGR